MNGNGTQPFATRALFHGGKPAAGTRHRDERLLAAMSTVPRHEFVSQQNWNEAYADHPIPIAEKQTTSQPYMIAAMIQAAEIKPEDRVLEIGAGSGYQTALLAELASQVFAVERYASLAQTAQKTLERLGYRNAKIVTGDGSLGLTESAPFDAIIVSAAAPHVPQALLDQLAVGGRLLDSDRRLRTANSPPYPAASRWQQLVRTLEGCRFVPLIGEQGFAKRSYWPLALGFF